MVVEHRNGAVDGATLNALTAAQALGGDITAIVAGGAPETVAKEIAKYNGITKVLVAKNDAYSHSLPETLAPLLVEAQKKLGFSHVFAGHTAFGKNVLPRVAALLDVAAISDITGIEGSDTFVRPIYAGEYTLGAFVTTEHYLSNFLLQVTLLPPSSLMITSRSSPFVELPSQLLPLLRMIPLMRLLLKLKPSLCQSGSARN